MKKSQEPCENAIVVLEKYLDDRENKNKSNMSNITEENCYLTEDEEITAISVAQIMALIGLGITKAIYLDVISAILQTRVDQKDFVYPYMMVLDRLLK